ncbi:MAG: hypothetical protein ACPG6B_06835 [Oceanihabitans sp.]
MELKWNTYENSGDSETGLAIKFVENLKENATLQFYNTQSAVYFLTNNSGSFSSIAFWENAILHSPRFANPGIFPWTLANATAAYLAKEFHITGPNYTLLENVFQEEKILKMVYSDKKKYSLKNVIIVFWQLENNANTINVKVKWTIVK